MNEHLQVVSEFRYGQMIKKYGNHEKLLQQKQHFDNFAYNAYVHYIEHGEVVHLNRVLSAAKILNRYREIRSLLTPIVAHKWENGNGGILDPQSKANKGKLRTLRENDYGEREFLKRFGQEQTKQQTAREFDLNKSIESLIRKAVKEGYTMADVQNHLFAIASKEQGTEKAPVRKAA